MRFFTALAIAASAACALAAEFTVLVGKDGGLTYEPTSVTAKVGDVIAFRFLSKNHTVTQSTFANPCEKMTTPAQGIDSGFMPVAPGATLFPQWSFTINNASAPLWFYCAQAPHCQRGMVFAINPNAEKTFDAFKANAAAGAAPSASGVSSGASPSASTTSGTTSGTAAGATPSNGASTVGRNTAGILLMVALSFVFAL
ncbi:hypothetical protein HGRIS_005749 [Hohenbuehelia grisea]|uniref:Cupredoxin n=1 Tax=Hohenbuehelia grisea TaxID=104357 RepID=A0ABR3JXS3_9AGAR